MECLEAAETGLQQEEVHKRGREVPALAGTPGWEGSSEMKCKGEMKNGNGLC